MDEEKIPSCSNSALEKEEEKPDLKQFFYVLAGNGGDSDGGNLMFH